ncbi:hypothetical protein E2C01_075218 [Portunus trituberculatus]|uniref:Uncharacterized protein n=1 Tax=Portunus trituberculatus TaxID=210409 RepID=A0A5B7IJH8_PORTR|nr:hypothetical protein [Portunus trituberculatus]
MCVGAPWPPDAAITSLHTTGPADPFTWTWVLNNQRPPCAQASWPSLSPCLPASLLSASPRVPPDDHHSAGNINPFYSNIHLRRAVKTLP